ncbi:MAG TPA: hypothetical protein VIL53_02035 [Solirubrobacterales bacterium]
MSEPPAPAAKDGAGRRGTGRSRSGAEAERAFQWYTPAGRRPTLYEDVTIDTQPSVKRHMDRGWLVNFEDGRGTWWEDSTRLRCGDWYDFRDPGMEWERPYYQKGSAAEHQIEAAVQSAREDRLFEDFSPEWVDFLRRNLQIPAFVEHGLWLATAVTARDCLSDSIAHCLVIEAAMKQRQAQALVLYGMDLEGELGGFEMEAAKSGFLEEEAWQPLRRCLERLATVTDWGEIIVAANACLEPLVGVMLRRELLLRSAPANGDVVTPTLMGAAQHEWDWVREWTVELIRFVTADEEHGRANRELVSAWLEDWLGEAREAAQALEPVFDQLPAGIAFEPALKNAERDLEDLLERSGVTEPREVTR